VEVVALALTRGPVRCDQRGAGLQNPHAQALAGFAAFRDGLFLSECCECCCWSATMSCEQEAISTAPFSMGMTREGTP
jgi:hypothetical protein